MIKTINIENSNDKSEINIENSNDKYENMYV